VVNTYLPRRKLTPTEGSGHCVDPPEALHFYSRLPRCSLCRRDSILVPNLRKLERV